MHEQQILASLGFPEPHNVRDRSSIADLFPLGKRCGIYVLHFENGEHYAGKAVDVVRRFGQHRQTHRDITALSFKQLPQGELTHEELSAIWTLEEAGFLLRNIAFTSIPRGDSDFDALMPVEDQKRWLADLSFIDNAGSRLVATDLRRKYRRKHEQLVAKPHASVLIQAMQTYVQLGLPAIIRGELDYWSVSCLPKPNIYGRININWQEVCTIGVFEGEPWVSVHLAWSPFDDRTDEELDFLTAEHPEAEWIGHFYQPGGPDQFKVMVPALAAAALFSHPMYLTAIRLLNMRLMKKGPNANANSHCLDLADHLIAAIP